MAVAMDGGAEDQKNKATDGASEAGGISQAHGSGENGKINTG